MAGGPGTITKVSGLVLGLIFALFCLADHHVDSGAVGVTMPRPASKALNKPLLIVGVDKKLPGLAFVFAVIVGANDGGSKIVAVVVFVATCAAGRRLTRKDPNIFAVMHRVWKQKTIYDQGKRA